MRMFVCFLLVQCWLVSALASTARADDGFGPMPRSASGRERLAKGNRLYNTREFEAAIIEYKAGAQIEPLPVFEYNLGQCYRHLNKYEEAIWYYDRFKQDAAPTGELGEAVERFLTEMHEHLNNRAREMPPTAVAPASEPTAKTTAPTATNASAEPIRSAHGSPSTDQAPPSQGSFNWAGTAVTATGGLALVGSGVLFFRASSLNDDANTEVNTRTRNDLRDQAHTRNIVGAVVGVGGVVLTATGVYMLITHGSRRDGLNTTSANLGISGRSLVVFGSF